MRFKDLLGIDVQGTVLLDVDGTLVPDGAGDLAPESAAALAALASKARVILVSNKGGSRVDALAARAGVEAHHGRSYKPFPFGVAVRGLEKPLTVIGDKFITDGVFAAAIGARFLKVRRIVSGHESLFLRAAYALDGAAYRVGALGALMRPSQWAKNLLVFMPLLFSHELFSEEAFFSTVLAFVVFCLAASAGYALNDALDAEADALHPTKRFRPIASGRLSRIEGLALATLLAFIGGYIAPSVPHLLPWFCVYLLLQYIYSTFLKTVPYVEMLAVVLLFLVRVLAGAAAADVPVSSWLILTTLCASLFVLSGKRYAEVRYRMHRPVLESYPAWFLRSLPAAAALVTIISYGLYAFVASTTGMMRYSVIFAAAGVVRYLYAVYERRAEDPETLLWSDPLLLSVILAWGASVFLALYGAAGFKILFLLWR